MNRPLATTIIALALLAILSAACSAPVAQHKTTVLARVASPSDDALFLFLFESTLLENGFTIHERALDSAGYRYIVTWTIPSASQQFWQRQYKMRFNGEVVATRSADEWLIDGRFGTFEDQHSASLTADFQSYVVEKVMVKLAQ